MHESVVHGAERGEVAQRQHDLRIVGTGGFLANGDRSLEYRLRFSVTLCHAVEFAQIGQFGFAQPGELPAARAAVYQ